MTRQELIANIKRKRSLLCVGLDPELERIPAHLLKTEDPIFEFNKVVIDATKDYAVAYKPNLAFYESLGARGWTSLEKTLAYIPSDCFTIADAKRGDIGNTSRLYAKAFFETFDFDAITVAPYMGADSVTPFLGFEGKWVIVLGLTSNAGSADFQMQPLRDGAPLYTEVIRAAQRWGTPDNLMFVIGATHPARFAEIRQLAPDHFFLVPGVGAQGGDLQAVLDHGRNADFGLLINSSRGIIYAGSGEDFGEGVREAALAIQQEMAGRISD
jgi:orotidine-5'-phosphate decarboxylase